MIWHINHHEYFVNRWVSSFSQWHNRTSSRQQKFTHQEKSISSFNVTTLSDIGPLFLQGVVNWKTDFAGQKQRPGIDDRSWLDVTPCRWTVGSLYWHIWRISTTCFYFEVSIDFNDYPVSKSKSILMHGWVSFYNCVLIFGIVNIFTFCIFTALFSEVGRQCRKNSKSGSSVGTMCGAVREKFEQTVSMLNIERLRGERFSR